LTLHVTRNLAALTATDHDLLVIGGGIYGLMAGFDAAQRGLRVALVERADFGSGTSFNHHRTLHGGLRYLQTLNLARVRESIRERRAFARMAPNLIAPQPFMMATGGSLARGPLPMRMAFVLDAALAADRNADVPEHLHLPAARVIDASEARRLWPDYEGGPAALWYDFQTTWSERLTFAVARAATTCGATLVSYADAIEPLRRGSRIEGMVVRDIPSGDRLEVRARVTMNAAGPGAGRVMAAFGLRSRLPLVKAMNVVSSRPPPTVAFGAPTANRRLLFALPWQGCLTVGTSHGGAIAGADATLVGASELEDFLRDVNSAFPRMALSSRDITLVQRGIVPARVGRDGAADLADRALLRDHRADGLEGAMSMVGVKYTTARASAERAVDLAVTLLGRRVSSCRTGHAPLPGSEGPSAEAPSHVDDESAALIRRLYGARAGAVLESCRSDAALATRVAPERPVILAQVIEAVRHEMALTLEDVVIRRTSLGAAGHPGDEVVRVVARAMQRECGWSDERTAEEIAQLRLFYQPV
jgi:glycerol-3-phosphate dehydrogenase